MNFITQTILTLLPFCLCEWILLDSQLVQDQLFQYSNNSDTYYKSAGNFIDALQNKVSAHFKTCTNPKKSYITINKNFSKIYISNTISSTYIKYYLFFDLIFWNNNWNEDEIQYLYNGDKNLSYWHTSNSSNQKNTGFCDDAVFEIKTQNFSIEEQIRTQHNFSFISSVNYNVSIQNIVLQGLRCHYTCRTCTDIYENNCETCFNGLSPNEGNCSDCPPEKPFLMRNSGCYPTCSMYSPLYKNGSCQTYPIYVFLNTYFQQASDMVAWTQIFDIDNFDSSANIQFNNQYYVFGFFKFKAGIQRLVLKEVLNKAIAFPFGFKIDIIYCYNQLTQSNVGGLIFKINGTYYGSAFFENGQLKFDQILFYQKFQVYDFANQSNCYFLELNLYIQIPVETLLFSIVGNFSNPNISWAIRRFDITSGFCPKFCSSCKIRFKCETCQKGYFPTSDGTCTQCQEVYQKFSNINDVKTCININEETQYSEMIIKEFFGLEIDPDQIKQYELINQTGDNFLRGWDVYYSVYNKIRIFGGPFVWSNAAFQRTFSIVDPHHKISIGFNVVLGPQFSGQFTYKFDDNDPVILTKDTDQLIRVQDSISHSQENLIIQWICESNDPIQEYCGFYNFFIVVHHCQPNCQACIDENQCSQQINTSLTYIFDKSQCGSNQYFDQEQYSCNDCPQLCETCLNKNECLTCKPSYILNNQQCKCQLNQYVDSDQCSDCPQICSQCLSSNMCTNCVGLNNRYLNNGQCECFQGYYEDINDPVCKLCHILCLTCSGPTNIECLSCDSNKGLQLLGTECKCGSNTFYSLKTLKCKQCHQNCLTCFGETAQQCLNCYPSENRELKGFQCLCQQGYYEQDGVCISCPINQDNSLIQCFHLCKDNSQVWYSTGCSDCDSGFNLINNECIPICGDSQKVGDEQCEDGNNIMFDGCYQCQFQCPDQCLTCDSSTALPCQDVCGDGIVNGMEECDDGNNIQYDGCYQCKFQCQEACTQCVLGKCQKCDTLGWYIATTEQSDFICKETCGDKLIVGSEQCEDLNSNPFDGCKDCRYFCRDGCETCDYVNNKCLKCSFPGYMPKDYYCKNICGDGLIVREKNGFYIEECEDGNNNENDGCFECKLEECHLYSNQCTQSQLNKQIQANLIGNLSQFLIYLLIKLNHANEELNFNSISLFELDIYFNRFQIRNSQLEVIQTINSEDNLINNQVIVYHQLKNIECKVFLNSECVECSQGHYLDYITNSCVSQCGDNIKVDDEECDDNNQQQYDGCYQCKFSCPFNCKTCNQGICEICNKNYSLLDGFCEEYLSQTFSYELDEYNEDENLFNSIYLSLIENHNTYSSNLQSFNQMVELDYLKSKEDKCDNQDLGMSILQFTHSHDSQLNNYQLCTQFVQYNEEKFEIDFNFQKILKLSEIHLNKQVEIFLNTTEYQNHQSEILRQASQYHISQSQQMLKECYYYLLKPCLISINNFIDGQEANINIIPFEILESDYQLDLYQIFPYDQCDSNCINCLEGLCSKCEANYIYNEALQKCVLQDPPQGYAQVNNPYQFDNCLLQSFTVIQSQLLNSHFEFQKYYNSGDKFQYYQIQGELNKLKQQVNYLQFLLREAKYQVVHSERIQNQCSEQCKVCSAGACIICQKGFYYDITSDSCKPQCGDKIVIGFEEVCDDGNVFRFDGCNKCQFECQLECDDCYMGQCQRCKENYVVKKNSGICVQKTDCSKLVGFYYDLENNFCISQCGDGIKAADEQCDDSNSEPYDGCYLCKYQCEINCEVCYDGICLKCKEGFDLENKYCKILCGDGIKTGNEECDDGNQLIRDGCTNCKIDQGFSCEQVDNRSYCEKCQENCIQCDSINKQIICKSCSKGYLLLNNQCVKCAEKCIDCEKTINNCITCVVEGCKTCSKMQGLYLDLPTKQCKSICGDGIIAEMEECDDGNQLGLDGCNKQCRKEVGFLCEKNVCSKQKEKTIKFQYNNGTSTKVIQLQFQELYTEKICSTLQIKIDLFNTSEYNYTSTYSNNLPSQNSSCEIIFDYFKTIDEANLIHIFINFSSQLNNSRILSDDIREIIITPRKVIYYNQQQQQQAQSIADSSKVIQSLLQNSVPITIVLGGFGFFWAILEILAWINNFYYMNVDFPINVKVLFNNLKWGDIFSLPNLYQLNQPEDLYYYQPPLKFQEKGVNAMYLNNIQLFIGMIAAAVILYILCIVFIQCVTSIYFRNYQRKSKKISIFCVNQKTLFKIQPTIVKSNTKSATIVKEPWKPIQIIFSQAFQFKEKFISHIFKIINLTFLDLCTASFLQLFTAPSSSEYIVYLNSLLAVITLAFILYVLRLQQFVCSQHEILLRHKLYYNKYSSFYEGIKLKNSFAKQFQFLNLIRKSFFIFSSIFFYNNPLIQTATCCLACFISILAISYDNPFEQKQDLILTLVPDCCVFIIIFCTVLLAWHDVSNVFSFEQKYFIGWIILVFLGLSITVQVLFLLFELFCNLKQKIVEFKEMVIEQYSKSEKKA